jgi:methionyl-tRNA formyltransferase
MVDATAARAGEPLRVVFFGTPAFAVPTLNHLIASRHTVCGVVTQPDRPRGRGHKVSDSPVKQAALAHGLPVFQPDRLREPDVVATIGAWRPDLGVVAAYGKLLPEDLLFLPRLGMINVHASLLPRYRGAAPVHRAVIDGAPETGVTIMRMVRALDAGDMLARVKRPIGPDETSDVVERDLAELGAALLVDVVEQLTAGTAIEERQDDILSSYAARLTKEEGLIDWSLPASYVHNRVRGLYPWPHAYSYLEGGRVIVLKTRVLNEPAGDVPTGTQPGTVLRVTRDAIHVATGHAGRIAIEELQPEGRKPMSVREFLAGRPVQPGARFGPQ